MSLSVIMATSIAPMGMSSGIVVYAGLLLVILAHTAQAQNGIYARQPPSSSQYECHPSRLNETQAPCTQAPIKAPDAGAAFAIGLVALLWIVGGVYAFRYRPRLVPDGIGECSESGDTEVDSTCDVESALPDQEVPSDGTDEQGKSSMHTQEI